jgi:putative tryptophan/tyrosine transport system substrate-binding protein
MRRRDVITLISGVTAGWPFAARAQQAKRVVGFLHAGLSGPTASYMAEFRLALAQAGYVDNQNIAIDYRYAEGQYNRLPELAADLVRRQVTVIVTAPSTNVARVAKAATSAIPIVFMIDDDPVKFGVVASLNRPGGNATGVNFLNNELVAKRIGLLHELLPSAVRFGALVNPSAVTAENFTKDVTAAALAVGTEVEIVHARDSREIDAAFATLAGDKVEGVIVAADALFSNRRVQIVTLATRHAMPAIYTVRAYVENGGLMSYGPSIPDTYRQLAIYTSRILKGEKPADLPVLQVNKFDFVVNRPTARSLGLTFPPGLLAIADEVIE